MTNQDYMKMLLVIHRKFEGDPIIIEWPNGLKIRCRSTTGIIENAAEPEDDDYVGEYSIGVGDVEILKQGNDDSVEIYENSIEIGLLNIPQKISSEDGTILWRRE